VPITPAKASFFMSGLFPLFACWRSAGGIAKGGIQVGGAGGEIGMQMLPGSPSPATQNV